MTIPSLTFENVPDSEFLDEKAEQFEKEQDEIVKKAKLNLSGIPSEYQKGFSDYITDTPERQKLLSVIQNCFRTWKEGKPVTVCLLGDCGIGKTKLANAFLVESLNETRTIHDIKCHYSIRYKLLDDIRGEYEKAKSFTSSRTQDKVIDEYSGIDLLVLDEIGLGENIELQKTIFYKLINERDLKKKTTIVISNYSFQEFALFCGRPTMDRLKNTAVFPKTENIESFRGKR